MTVCGYFYLYPLLNNLKLHFEGLNDKGWGLSEYEVRSGMASTFSVNSVLCFDSPKYNIAQQ